MQEEKKEKWVESLVNRCCGWYLTFIQLYQADVIRTNRDEKQKLNYLTSRHKKRLTIAVHHNQACDHQNGVPVKLSSWAVPGKTTAPLAVPQTHPHHASQTQAQAQQVADVEAQNGPHPGEVGRLEQMKAQGK